MRFLFPPLLFLLLLAGGVSGVSAQTPEKLWQVLDSFPARINAIRFLDLPGPPRIGFVGIKHMVYRTTDGGLHWDSTKANTYNFDASDFTFKDSLTGWFSNAIEDTTAPSCYKTTDGGLTWTSLIGPSHLVSSIIYRPAKKLLLMSGWGYNSQVKDANSSYSTDEGLTWKIFFSESELNGYAFMDDNLGISGCRVGGLRFARTTDGGFTWSPVTTSPDESYQPLADTIRHVFWAATDFTHLLFCSSDGGNNFVALPTPVNTPGTLLGGGCGDLNLYAQEHVGQPDSHLGVILSTDGGTSWNGIKDKNQKFGPAASNDARFFIKGSYIFAPEQLDGKAYVLWRYIGDSNKYGGQPVIRPFASTNDLHVITSSCADLDTQVTVTFVNDCVTAELVSAHFEPSDRFIVNVSDPLPHTLTATFPLIIQHRPQSQQRDTANLILIERVGGALTYDTIRVTGEIAPNPKTVTVDVFVNNTKLVTTKPGDTVTILFRLMNAVAGSLGLDSIQVETIYDGGIMDELTYNILPPWSLLHKSHSSGIEKLAVRHKHGEDLVANSDIAQIFYRTYLTPNGTGAYTFDKIQFNDSVLTGCVQATALLTPATITVSTCGDTTIRAFMDGLPLARLMGIVRNDDQYSLKISTTAPMPLAIGVFNILGERVRTFQLTSLGNGQQLVPLNTHGLPSGSYWVSISAWRGASSLASPAMNGHFFLAQ